MEEVCERGNLVQAWKQVPGNKGSPGVDGKTIDETLETYASTGQSSGNSYFKEPTSRNPCGRVEIPKPGGGVRKLGIPTVRDRRFGVGRNIRKLSRGNRFNLGWKNRTVQVFTQFMLDIT